MKQKQEKGGMIMNTYFVTFLIPRNGTRRIVLIKELNFEKALRKVMAVKYFEEEIISIIKEEK